MSSRCLLGAIRVGRLNLLPYVGWRNEYQLSGCVLIIVAIVIVNTVGALMPEIRCRSLCTVLHSIDELGEQLSPIHTPDATKLFCRDASASAVCT